MTKEQTALLKQFGFVRRIFYSDCQSIKSTRYQRKVKSNFIVNCLLIVKNGLIHLQGEDKITRRVYTINTFEITANNLIKLID